MTFAFWTSAITAKSLEAKRTGAALGIKARKRLALSGTPILNRPIEIYPVLSWLLPQEWPSDGYFDFAQRYCGAYHNGFGWDLTGASNLPELSHRLHSSVMIRRTKAQVLPQLPEKIRTVIELYPTGAGMKRIIRQEIEVYEARYLKVDHDSINWDDLARVRHQTALAKVPLDCSIRVGSSRRRSAEGCCFCTSPRRDRAVGRGSLRLSSRDTRWWNGCHKTVRIPSMPSRTIPLSGFSSGTSRPPERGSRLPLQVHAAFSPNSPGFPRR